jgi:DNA-binding MarR family transcriptional regulator
VKIEYELQTGNFRNEQHKATLNILFTAYAIQRDFADKLKPFGITPEQYNVLRILKGKFPQSICVRDIRSRMIERSSNVPRILDRLEGKGYIRRERSESDGRETLVCLTNEGQKFLEKLTGFLEHEERTLPISEAEAWALNELLDKCRD